MRLKVKECLKRESEADEKGSQRGWLIFLTAPPLTCGLALLVQPHFKAKGARKHKQPRSCSWSGEASRLLTETSVTVNNGSSDAQDFGVATDACCSSERPFTSLRLHLRSVNIYPTGKHASFPSLLFCTREDDSSLGLETCCWMLGIRSSTRSHSSIN